MTSFVCCSEARDGNCRIESTTEIDISVAKVKRGAVASVCELERLSPVVGNAVRLVAYGECAITHQLKAADI